MSDSLSRRRITVYPVVLSTQVSAHHDSPTTSVPHRAPLSPPSPLLLRDGLYRKTTHLQSAALSL